MNITLLKIYIMRVTCYLVLDEENRRKLRELILDVGPDLTSAGSIRLEVVMHPASEVKSYYKALLRKAARLNGQAEQD
jgi:hypothetical protein